MMMMKVMIMLIYMEDLVKMMIMMKEVWMKKMTSIER